MQSANTQRRWWDVGTKPVVVLDPTEPVTFEASDGWAFDGISPAFIDPSIQIQAVCGFGCLLTNDQLILATHMVNQDMVIPGWYEDWEYFLLVHNLL